MKIKFSHKGKTAEFEAKPKRYDGQRLDETFNTSLVRCYYPMVYRKLQKIRGVS